MKVNLENNSVKAKIPSYLGIQKYIIAKIRYFETLSLMPELLIECNMCFQSGDWKRETAEWILVRYLCFDQFS